MSREFRTYAQAKAYADRVKRLDGLHAYIEEMYDSDGRFYLVMVWD